ncbi:transcription factor Ovo-like 2 isoform X2 [Balaenoptera musculus]|uniref:Transcription factor Ovo-like 2 isoform X2 n=1 Tax=Balaenoptera musculus TaxID=9771 RepID=A0A8B8V663_BALMU|nr:transcription factor Ovo-like 2 isoform X2 [Balaenoptera musculus]
MPKVFLVKRRSPGVSVRSWDELPDEERADTYIPVGLGRLLHDPPEDCRSDGGSSSGGGSNSAGEPGGAESSSSPRAPEPGDGEVPGGHLAAKQRPVARSKIKFTTGTCGGDAAIHTCDLCGKAFRLQRMLNRHLKCHSQVKRHLCSFCGKGFNDTFDLKRHVRTHTAVILELFTADSPRPWFGRTFHWGSAQPSEAVCGHIPDAHLLLSLLPWRMRVAQGKPARLEPQNPATL